MQKHFPKVDLLLSLLSIPLALYLFPALLPLVWAISTGLDQSWQYAISRAALDKLVFGRDILFPYGPFGYLVHGAVLEQNFYNILIFRFLVYSALFGVAVVKIVKLKTKLQKAAVAISLFLALLILLQGSTDYQLIFTALLLISFDNFSNKKTVGWWSIALGALAGFCLLIKFTLGVCVVGSLLLVLLYNLYRSFRLKVDQEIYSAALANALLATTSISFIFINPNHIESLQSILICLGFSLFCAVLLSSVRSLTKPADHTNLGRLINRFNPRLLGWYGFYGAYSLSLIFIVLTSSSLVDYLRGSLSISSGYSSAMSYAGSPWEVGLAVIEVGLILVLLVAVARETSAGFALASGFVLWIIFKHGFIRQDGHVLYFVLSTPLIVSLCIDKVRKTRSVKFAYSVHAFVLAVVLIYHFVATPFGNQVGHVHVEHSLSTANVSKKASVLLNLGQFQESLNQESAANLARVKLPENVREILKDKTVDIVPWEISLIGANQLNWKPRPIFQSYAAYTDLLDRINFNSLRSQPRDYLLYQFISIDGRHPFFDEPQTFFHILCNYKLSSAIPSFIETPSLVDLMLLEPRQSSICSSGKEGKQLSLGWNTIQPLAAEDGQLVRAGVKVKYSLLGKLYKTLFRSPPVLMHVVYADNRKQTYRILPENSGNGIIISHLPQDRDEAFEFFQGRLSERVKSFSFSTNNLLLYAPKIEISFISHDMQSFSAKQQPNINTIKIR